MTDLALVALVLGVGVLALLVVAGVKLSRRAGTGPDATGSDDYGSKGRTSGSGGVYRGL